MKKFKLNNLFALILLVGLLIGFTSCSTNEELDNNIERIIKKIESTPVNEGCCISYFDFREDGKIDRFGYYGNPPDVYHGYYYDDQDKYIGATGYANLTYEGNILTGSFGITDTGTGSANYIYDGNIINSEGFYNGEPNNFKYVYEFNDNTYSKLLSITVYDDILSTPYIKRITTFEYDGDLLVKSEEKEFNESTGEFETKKSFEFTYDNQKNPYKLGLQQNAFVTSFIFIPKNYYVPQNLTLQMDHNIVSQKITNFLFDNVGFYEREYTYDEFGYPVSYSENLNGEPIRDVTFEYY
jgi:hypothetical protein